MSDDVSGWNSFASGPFPEIAGPYRARREGEGWAYAFVTDERHLNRNGVVHGGALMSFADDTLGATLWEIAGRRPISTVQLNTHFVAPVRAGDVVHLRAELVRQTRTLLFVRATLDVQGRTVAALDGIWKILGER